MHADTEIGGTRNAFPQTRHSIVAKANSENASVRERAFDALIAVYWKPVYKYIRIKWSASNEDAKDLTQDFFAAAFEKAFFESYDAGKRPPLRPCVDLSCVIGYSSFLSPNISWLEWFCWLPRVSD